MKNQLENIAQDLEKVEEILSNLLTGSYLESNINDMCLRVVKAGGKRIRPKLAILAYHALNKKEFYKRALNFAAATELLHTATLVHDDVIDKADCRRGKETLNNTDGNHAAVLAGDYLFTKCFMCLHDVDKPQLYKDVSNTLSALVSGEINQLENQGKIDITIEDYLETIYCKTGALFELTTSGVAILTDSTNEEVTALKEYGKQLGIAFQVADDILDYTSDKDKLGKPVGEDLFDGRITLPLIYALEDPCIDHSLLKDAIEHNKLDIVLDCIKKSNAIEKAYEFAINAATKAKDSLKCLKQSEYVQMLCDLADHAVKRDK